MEKIQYLDLRLENKKILDKTRFKIINQIYSGRYILDKNVELFERKFAKFNNAKFCYGVNSGHDALKIALQSIGVKNGDHIMVPGMTFISTYFAISELGAKPVPIDVGLDGVIDCNKLPKNLDKKIKGLISVNLYGNLCNYKILRQYTKKNKIFLIEDSSQSHNAFFLNEPKKKIWGDISTFSFYPGKNLGSITDGGAIITNKPSIAHNIKLIRNYGSIKKYIHQKIGCNSRLNSTSAIFLNLKLKYLPKINKLRLNQENFYIKYLKNIKQISFLHRNKDVRSSHHIFLILTKERNKLKDYLAKNNIETIIHYPITPFLQKAYYGIKFKKEKYPVSIKLQNEGLSLPIGKHINTKKQLYIIAKIKKFYQKK